MNIALWGAGKAGQAVLGRLGENLNIKCFIDIDERKHGDHIGSLPIYSPSYLSDGDIDAVVITMFSIAAISSASIMASKYGIKYGVLRRSSIESNLDSIEFIWPSKPFFSYLELNLTDKCNLNCKGCTHFSNLYKASENDYPIESFKVDIRRLSETVEIDRIRLLGGEPLLIDNLDEYVECVRRYFNQADIHVVTNGLLIPNLSERIWSSFREADVTVDVSTYEPTVRIIDSIKECCEEHNVQCKYTEIINKFHRFVRLKGDSDVNASYSRCSQSSCKILSHGRIYRCPFEGVGKGFSDIYKLDDISEVIGNQGYDIDDESVDWNGAVSDLHSPGELCRYCDESGGEEFEWITQYAPELQDWIVE